MIRIPDEIEWPPYRERWEFGNHYTRDTRRFRVFFRSRIPPRQHGYFRWAVRLFGHELVWVNRGSIRDGYFVFYRDGQPTDKAVNWPRSRLVRNGPRPGVNGAGGRWWQTW